MRKQNYIAIIIAIYAIFQSFSSCAQRGNNDESGRFEETRNLQDFKGVELSLKAEVYITQSPDYVVKVMTNRDVLNKIETKVSDGKLTITANQKNPLNDISNLQIKLFISLPNIENLKLFGSGDINAKKIETKDISLNVSGSGGIAIGNLLSQNLEATVNGSGDINLGNLLASSLVASVSGSGDIRLASEQEIETCSFSVFGSGDISAEKLKAQNIDATVNGSGDIYTYPLKQIKARVNGSGDIYYKGEPSVESSVSGSGDVKAY